jgi:hypothetical protein
MKVTPIYSIIVIDFIAATFSEEFIAALPGKQDYTDNHLKEHMYNIDNLIEEEDHPTLCRAFPEELKAIKLACSEHAAAYFGIIYH